MATASRENFSVASVLVGRAACRHLRAIYGFARLVDDVGDAAAGDRPQLLDLVELDLERVFAGAPSHPLLRNLVPTARELALPREPFLRLIEANRQDQVVTRYESFEELRRYCGLSADPVGELVLHVFGQATPDRIARSDRICTALQLVEHLQDVGEDFRNGRIYLPLEDMAQFDVEEAELGEAQASARLRALLAFESERARGLLDGGAPLVRLLRPRARLAVAAYVGGGRAALAALASADYEVLAGSPRAGGARRALETLGALT
jgi:squalene synthase HpnC